MGSFLSTPISKEEMSEIKEKVENIIAENKVVVFSKSYCPYCGKAKEALKKLGYEFHVIELDKEDDGDDIQDYLKQKTGQRTVPNIFINRKHIGGCDDLNEKIKSGKVQEIYNES